MSTVTVGAGCALFALPGVISLPDLGIQLSALFKSLPSGMRARESPSGAAEISPDQVSPDGGESPDPP